MVAEIVPIKSGRPALEATLISEPWSYHSTYGTGSDQGYKFCVYVPAQGLAVYVRTRHQMKGADPQGAWKPRNPEDHFYDETKKDIWERYTLPVFKTFGEQLSYIKSLDEPQIVGPQPELKATPGKEIKIFINPTIKKVSLSEAKLRLLFQPIQRREDGAGLFDLLYSYVDEK